MVGWLLALVIVAAFGPVAPLHAQAPDPLRRVNVPYFANGVRYSEMAIFWFGHLDSANNFVDVRVGSDDRNLRVEFNVYDRYLWYDPTPDQQTLTAWDAGTLYLDVDGDGDSLPGEDDYRFEGQLNWWESGDQWQATYRGDGAGWSAASVPITVTSGWNGNAPNDMQDDRGWVLRFLIPFESLGLTGPPAAGTVWRMGVAVHDRDDQGGTPIGDKSWPETFDAQRPESWGELHFGLPGYDPPTVVNGDSAVIRQGLNNTTVMDAAVGGTIGNLCPGSPNIIWYQWANANFAGANRVNIAAVGIISDWPCHSKYYVTFPLDAVPAGRAVVSATLMMHKMGGSDITLAKPSLIQAFTIAEPWDEATLTWNNAPLAAENVARTWVEPVKTEYPTLPGEPAVWDVSRAAADAYAAGQPLRLALYEADWALHSSKYFLASDEEDYYAEGRPTLRVAWGEPVGTVGLDVSASTVASGDVLTYTLSVLGSGQSLSLVNDLPAGVTAPIRRNPALVYAPHALSWQGTPALGERVVMTYTVNVAVSSTTQLLNQALLSQPDGHEARATVTVLVDPVRVYMPTILR